LRVPRGKYFCDGAFTPVRQGAGRSWLPGSAPAVSSFHSGSPRCRGARRLRTGAARRDAARVPCDVRGNSRIRGRAEAALAVGLPDSCLQVTCGLLRRAQTLPSVFVRSREANGSCTREQARQSGLTEISKMPASTAM